jgi:hypothetical protein
MTSVRLLTAAVILCTVSAFAQEQHHSATRANRAAEPDQSVRVTTSEPWKIVTDQPTDSRAGTNSLQQKQIDAYQIDRSRIDPNRRPFRWDPQVDPILMDGQLGDDTVCYKIRSYVVARDHKDSDSVHPVGYSTCRPASRYRLRTTQIHSDWSGR